jgi:hypothetical protein
MKKRSDVFERFRDSFSKLDGRFHVLEQRVPIEVQFEYFKCSSLLRRKSTEMTDIKYHDYLQSLANETLPAEDKRHVLSALAVSNDVRAYRLLEEYVQHPDPDLTNWAYMALMESRITLESELSEEQQIYISTGLGGRGEKLRFYVLLVSSQKEPFLPYQRQTIEREFAYYLEREDCEIERLTIYDQYIELVALISVRKDIKGMLDNVVNECNQYGNFISEALTVTNMKELSAEEIAEIINTTGYGNKNNYPASY